MRTWHLMPHTDLLINFPNKTNCQFMLPNDSMTLCLLKVKASSLKLYPQVALTALSLEGANTEMCESAGIQFMEPFSTLNVLI